MKITLIGTGLMGRPMTVRLLQAGHEVTVFNRTKEKAWPLAALGAKVADSAQEAIKASPVTVLMVADAPACEAVLFPSGSAFDLKNRTIIQMGTISPQQSLDLAQRVARAGGAYLEAPVLGSIAEAEKGELVVLVGATEEQFQQYFSLLRCFSPEPVYVGPVGQAAAFKLALNQLIASLTACFAFSLGIIKKRGVPREKFMEVLRRTSLYAYHFDKKLNRMWQADYAQPTFPLRLLYKDVSLMIEEAESLGLETAGLAGMQRIIKKAMDLGWGEKDYTAIASAIIEKL